MNHDKLLHDSLNSEIRENARVASLQAGLQQIRFAKRIDKVVRLSLGIIMLGFSSLLWWSTTSRQISHLTPKVPKPQQVGGIHILTQSEFITLFSNRSFVILGEPGHQRVLFLDDDKSLKE